MVNTPVTRPTIPQFGDEALWNRSTWVLQQRLNQSDSMPLSAFMGLDDNSPIVINNRFDQDVSATNNKVIYLLKGDLTNPAITGDKTWSGTGETIDAYSQAVSVMELGFTADLMRDFDSLTIGGKLMDVTDATSRLIRLANKHKAQAIIDVLQDEPATNPTLIDYGTEGLTYDKIAEIAGTLDVGVFDGKVRVVPRPHTLSPLNASGEVSQPSRYYLFINHFQKATLMNDPKFKEIMVGSDLRGNKNRMISGYLGEIMGLHIIVLNTIKGTRAHKVGTFMGDNLIEAGLRYWDTNGKVVGEEGFTYSSDKYVNHAFIMGGGAVIASEAGTPFIRVQEEDFARKKEVAYGFNFGVAVRRYNKETPDGKIDPINGVDIGKVLIKTTDVNFTKRVNKGK